MDQQDKSGDSGLLWLHLLECFWNCSYRPEWPHWNCDIHQFLWGHVCVNQNLLQVGQLKNPGPQETLHHINDYRPVALTSVVMKSFERLVLAHLNNIADTLPNPLQFAYWAKWDCATSWNTLTVQGHMWDFLFMDIKLPFNSIIPDILCSKVSQLTLPDPIWQWITNRWGWGASHHQDNICTFLNVRNCFILV